MGEPTSSIRERLSYNPETGEFTWLVRGKGIKRSVAGSTRPDGYVVIKLDGVRYYAHRLAVWFATGEWPEVVDHRNGNPSDNRLCNLRPCTTTQNQQNRRASGSKLKGAFYHKRDGVWLSRISVNGQGIHLGTFSTPEEAHAAYRRAADSNFGEFSNYG